MILVIIVHCPSKFFCFQPVLLLPVWKGVNKVSPWLPCVGGSAFPQSLTHRAPNEKQLPPSGNG